MLIRYKKIISVLMAMAVSASAISVFAADVTNDDIVIKTDDTVLVKDVDYTLEYKDNVNVGTAKVIVHFIGNYSGEKEQMFNINRKTSGSGGGGSSRPSSNTVTVTVTDKDGKPITTTKKEENDKVIITLPSNKELKDDEPYTVTVTDKGGKPVETEITLKDKKGNEATGKTDSNGKVTLPQTVEVTPSPMPTNEPEEAEHNAYISGYEDGTFIPDGQITRAETASMLYGVLETSNKEIDVTFSDLKDGAWYMYAVQAMTNAGIISGYTDGTFRPDRHITRAEFVTMLMRTKDIQTFDVIPFTDVAADLWSADYIYTAYTNGYIDGYEDGTFQPDSPITRAEAVKIINEVLGRTDFRNEINPFSDVSNMHWAYKHILEAAVTHKVK